ncbi:DUF742 domain-containing protein [Streptomyces sp. TRM 70361]|uniref:DUF742 domain-containing protein n=1 Tax=Streptomyces sp. TRM 70361 TaxID=3116553 RepID=UPI002E7B7839|nr:DUF742 domain-containing protein [Streptomyces sp. TRM 70361]MEE1940230.1 DUF742 domain-containing protein [Streptomyces sp. TRM 70361]
MGGHWTDDLGYEEADDSLVRPYAITRGRTVPERGDLGLITVVTTVGSQDDQPSDRGLEPEHQAIVEQCRGSAAVAEIAAALDLPVSVTKILIDDLVSLGRVTVRPPLVARENGGLNVTLLQAVRDGLRKL